MIIPKNNKHVLDPAKDTNKPVSVASKANKRAMTHFALTLKTMKLLRFITKAKSVEWHGGEAWKMKKSLLEKYRPDLCLNLRNGSMMFL
jgi:hypothetical protein